MRPSLIFPYTSPQTEWHRQDFLDPKGHPINRAGVEIDDAFQPVDNAGRPVYQNLFAAGSILAHQDWMRMKCGSGLAIATAYGAVNAFLRARGTGTSPPSLASLSERCQNRHVFGGNDS